MMSKVLCPLDEWLVEATLDDDGHLTIWITHADDSGVEPIGLDDGRVENGWSDRFTTRIIESEEPSWNTK